MWLFKKRENRAEETAAVTDASTLDDLIQAILWGNPSSKKMALQIPTIAGAIDLIANVVAATPIKLYRDEGGQAVEVTDDPRVFLLNDEPGDTLNANEFWHAIIRDFYLGKGGYAFINSEGRQVKSIHYVDEYDVAIIKNSDPIFKEYDITVNGIRYFPFQFLKILRNTKDGAQGTPITEENSKLIEAMFKALVLENNMAARGGNKRGFLQSEGKLEQKQLDALRSGFQKMYSSENSENFVLLNKGITFKEASDTAVEMQLNENKETNAAEFAKLFHVSLDAMSGKSSSEDSKGLAKMAAIPLMVTIQCALNRDLLLESEKHGKSPLYWAFDTKDLLKGDMKERFDAYKVALDSNFMQIDEVRYKEDLAPLGLTWIKLGLQDVLYDPKTKTIYTPNTDKTSEMGSKKIEEPAKPPEKKEGIDE